MSASPASAPPIDPSLRQRDYLLRIARAMTEALEPRDVMALVLKSAVTMTGGTAGAIAIRGDGRGDGRGGAGGGREDDTLRIVASYHLEEKLVDHIYSRFAADDGFSAGDGVGSPGHEAGAMAAAQMDASGGDNLAGSAGDEAALMRALTPAANLSRPALPPPAGPLVAVRRLPGDDEALDVLTLPLMRREREIGQIVVFRSQGAAAFSNVDEDLLRAFADQAAAAIQNALLHARLAARERQLAAVVDGNPTGLLLLDARGRIAGVNPAAERLLGRARPGLIGRDLDAVLPIEGDDGQRVAIGLPAMAEGTVEANGRLRHGARQPWVQVSVRALPAAEDAVGDVDAPRAAGPTGARGPDGVAAADGHVVAGIDGYVVSLIDLSGWREAENAKNTFLAGLSHELKTPLALIRGFAETLGQPEMARDDAFRGQAVDVILEEASHLTRMVDQLLLAARLNAGALPLDWHTVDLRDVLQRAVDAFRRLHPDRLWHADLADVGPIVADPVRLKEVFTNLLSNAVKYSAPDTAIGVVLGSTGPEADVVVQVIDRGIGISDADQEQLFGRFFRAKAAAGADPADPAGTGGAGPDGTGLGLYMCRAIVAAHGGRIDAQSALGQGSTFTVRLPRRPAAAGAAVAGRDGVDAAADAVAEAGSGPADRAPAP